MLFHANKSDTNSNISQTKQNKPINNSPKKLNKNKNQEQQSKKILIYLSTNFKYKHIISAVRRQKQENCHKFKARLGYTRNLKQLKLHNEIISISKKKNFK